MSTGLKTLAPLVVTNAGTRVQLTTVATDLLRPQVVRIEADRNNTGELYVGDANVSSSCYTTRLRAGDSISIEGSAIISHTIWFDASVNGTTVQVSWL